MHILAIGDIGVTDRMIHIGDEAMFEQLTLQLRSRGVDRIIGLSANPTDTAARYGIDSIERLGFSGSRDQMSERMDAILRAASSGTPAPDDRSQAVLDAVRSSNGVAVAGGGNMASTWPMHIYERATLGALAAIVGVPFVVSGQTIGPALDAADATLVTAALSSARRVGLREPSSLALCTAIGVPTSVTTQTVDDASFLHYATPDAGEYCLVTLAAHVGDQDRDAMVRSVAALLDEVVAETGLAIRFAPHFGSLDPAQALGDSVMHAAVAALMRADSSEIPAVDAAASAHLARAASLVVTSRYHPAVFAVSAGVPTIGLPVDDYTTVKLTGALGNFDQHGIIRAAELQVGHWGLGALWGDRHGIRSRGLAAALANRSASDAWWDAVAGEF